VVRVRVRFRVRVRVRVKALPYPFPIQNGRETDRVKVPFLSVTCPLTLTLTPTRSDRADQITREALAPQEKLLIQKKQLRLSKEVLGYGYSGIVKKGTFGSCAVAVKHIPLQF
jgi:hypothetical protein